MILVGGAEKIANASLQLYGGGCPPAVSSLDASNVVRPLRRVSPQINLPANPELGVINSVQPAEWEWVAF
jgi:hypothetical protein